MTNAEKEALVQLAKTHPEELLEVLRCVAGYAVGGGGYTDDLPSKRRSLS